ncbi:hypothetical protein HDU99_001088 [Rhizoclosmatium hyalinum]|nr:hypothetical protein HDU99_001088 [Rhizoclosmatium hyalinum]
MTTLTALPDTIGASVSATAIAPTVTPTTAPPQLSTFGSLPVNWQAKEGLPQEPTMKPFHNKTQTVTLHGAITAYLITISIWININLLFSFFGAAYAVSWISISLCILSLIINGLMFFAIQPDRLIPILMDIFAYFYIVRAIIDIAFTIYIFVVTVRLFTGFVWVYGCLIVLELIAYFFMVKHSFVYRAYAFEVRKKLSGHFPTNFIAVETAAATAV